MEYPSNIWECRKVVDWGIIRRQGSHRELGFRACYYPQWLPPVVYEVGIGILQDQELSCQNGMQGQDHGSFWSDLMLNPKLMGGTFEFLLREHNRRDWGWVEVAAYYTRG